jgi:dihydroorotase (homodimeric type)
VTTLHLRRPDDWHLHLRDGVHMAAVLPHTAARFARALVMPNLRPPMTTTAALAEYRARILGALPAGTAFEPLMTLYLTDRTPAEEIRKARASGFVVGAKLYPAGATTHSDAGVTSIDNVWGALEAMAEAGLVLQVHGEVTSPDVDVFDRERAFIDRVLCRVVERVPGLRVVFEHVTTAAAVEFVRAARPGVAATMTPQHLLMNRNALFEGGRVDARPVEGLYVVAVRGTGPQLAARGHLDQYRGQLEQGVGIRVEPAGLHVDHDREEAAETAGDACGEVRDAHSATRRQPTLPPARSGTSSSPPNG